MFYRIGKRGDSRKDAKHAKFGQIQKYFFFALSASSREKIFEVALSNISKGKISSTPVRRRKAPSYRFLVLPRRPRFVPNTSFTQVIAVTVEGNPSVVMPSKTTW